MSDSFEWGLRGVVVCFGTMRSVVRALMRATANWSTFNQSHSQSYQYTTHHEIPFPVTRPEEMFLLVLHLDDERMAEG